MSKRTRRVRQRGWIRRRGNAWVVGWRHEGRQYWRSFKTQEAAELELERVRLELRTDTFAAPKPATFREARDEWLRYVEHDRGIAPSTLRDYKSCTGKWLLKEFGDLQLSAITAARFSQWRSEQMRAGKLPRRTAAKVSALAHAIFERARSRETFSLARNPIAEVEKIRVRYDASEYDFYTPEEVWALVRAADSDQDAAIYLVAAFAGLRRGEVLGLRVRDVDFANDTIRVMQSIDTMAGPKSPKSGKGRSVPMLPEVAQVLARELSRDDDTAADDLVFRGEGRDPETGRALWLDGSALLRRFKTARDAAGLRPLRFHDLRHTFGSNAINAGSLVDVQHWLGHADPRTTARYLHYKARTDEAQRLAAAFKVADPELETVETAA